MLNRLLRELVLGSRCFLDEISKEVFHRVVEGRVLLIEREETKNEVFGRAVPLTAGWELDNSLEMY